MTKGSRLTESAGNRCIHQQKEEATQRKEEEEKKKRKMGPVMGTLTSKGGSIGPVMVQMAAVSRSKPSEVMLLPKSKVADVLPVCIRRSHHADQCSQLSQTMLMHSCINPDTRLQPVPFHRLSSNVCMQQSNDRHCLDAAFGSCRANASDALHNCRLCRLHARRECNRSKLQPGMHKQQRSEQHSIIKLVVEHPAATRRSGGAS